VTEFTPISSLVGGGLIGLAATLLMVGPGRVLGASGVLAGVIFPTNRTEFMWRMWLIAGLVASAILMALVFGITPNVVPPIPPWQVALGGFIVGIGVTLGGG